ncbi:hypothetical protein OM209_20725 [Escherichia albertii]|nr:hypothetical protein [Escherichia coli]MCZ9188183.1 hypothetical protein [Escherichia albertii]HBB9147906.1 hypothetical protein [Escherichia coli]HBB9161998.1 hypothetical protein [Escherichia coli]
MALPTIRHAAWALWFRLPADELFGSFFDAMNAFEYPFGNSGLSRHMHDTDKSGVDLKLVWLERGVLLLMYFQLQGFLISVSSSSSWPKNLRHVE